MQAKGERQDIQTLSSFEKYILQSCLLVWNNFKRCYLQLTIIFYQCKLSFKVWHRDEHSLSSKPNGS